MDEKYFIEYKFYIKNAETKSYKIIFDDKEEKCPFEKNNCLDCINNNENKCILYKKLIEYIEFFGKFPSYENISVEVITPYRTYTKKCSLQEGARSLLGIIMPTSGCPVFKYLYPMARFHLPFSSIEETQFRVMGMYLLGQYLRMNKDLPTDWGFENLINIYSNIRDINKAICNKIRESSYMDGSINAIIILDILADQVLFTIDEKELEFFYRIYDIYLTI
jgi:hypothetical protein